MGVVACSTNSTCTITGSVSPQLDSVYLLDAAGKRLDATAVQDGVFTLTCERNPQCGVSVITVPKGDPVNLIPDSEEINVTIKDGMVTVGGSPLSEELQELQQWMMNLFTSYSNKSMALSESGDETGVEALMEEMEKAMAEHCKEIYLNHLQDPVGVRPCPCLSITPLIKSSSVYMNRAGSASMLMLGLQVGTSPLPRAEEQSSSWTPQGMISSKPRVTCLIISVTGPMSWWISGPPGAAPAGKRRRLSSKPTTTIRTKA